MTPVGPAGTKAAPARQPPAPATPKPHRTRAVNTVEAWLKDTAHEVTNLASAISHIRRATTLPEADVAISITRVQSSLLQDLEVLATDPQFAINALNVFSHVVQAHVNLGVAVKSDPKLREVTARLFEAALSDDTSITHGRNVTKLAAVQARIGCYCRPFWDAMLARGPPEGPVVAASLLCHSAQLATQHRYPPPSPELLSTLCHAVEDAARELNTQQILMCVSALSKLRTKCGNKLPKMQKLLEAIYAKATACDFSAKELVVVVQCIARLRYSPQPHLAAALTDASIPALRWMSPPDAAGTIRALSQLNVPLTATQCGAALEPFEELASRKGNANSNWDRRQERRSSRAQDASSILHALAALPNPLDGPDEELDERCLALLQVALAELPTLTAPGLLAGYLTSLARIATEWPAAQRGISLDDVFSAVLRCANLQGPQAVSNTLFALVVLTASGSKDTAHMHAAVNALRRRALDVVGNMVPTSLTKTLWALSFLLTELSPREQDAYHRSVQRLSSQASPNFFSHCLSSLASIEHNIPAATENAVLAGIQRQGSKMMARDVAITFAGLARLELLTPRSKQAISQLLIAVCQTAPKMSGRDLVTISNVLSTRVLACVDRSCLSSAVAALHTAAEAAASGLSAAHFAGLVRSLAALEAPLPRDGKLRARLPEVVHKMHSTEATSALYGFMRAGALSPCDKEAVLLVNMAAKQVEYVERRGSVRDLLLGLHALGVPLHGAAGEVVRAAMERVPGLPMDTSELCEAQRELGSTEGEDEGLDTALTERWGSAMTSYEGRSARSTTLWKAKEVGQLTADPTHSIAGGKNRGGDSDDEDSGGSDDEFLDSAVLEGMPQDSVRDQVLGGSWEQAGVAVMLSLVESKRSLKRVARAAIDSGAMYLRSLHAHGAAGGSGGT
jgi:hypothetical protein